MKLRDYQKELLDRLDGSRRGLIFMATGLGKTFVAAAYAARIAERGLRTLFISPSVEICDEFRMALEALRPGVQITMNVGGSRPNVYADAMAMTFAAAVRKTRLAAAVRFAPDVVFVDEAHYASPLNLYDDILNALNVGRISFDSRRKLFFMTATPRRMDGVGLGHFVDEILCEYSISWGIENGWLVPPRAEVFSYASLVSEHYAIRDAVGALLEAKALPAMVFVSSVSMLYQIEEIFDFDGVYATLHSKTSRVKRDDIVRAFREGSIDLLFVCRALQEGVSFPAARSLIISSPTNSPVRYTQMVGRVLRPHDPAALSLLETREERLAAIRSSPKPFAYIIDLVPEREGRTIITFADISKATILRTERAERVRSVEERARSEGLYVEIVTREEEKIERFSRVIDLLRQVKESPSGFLWVRLGDAWYTFYDDMEDRPTGRVVCVPDGGDVFYFVRFGGWSPVLRTAVRARVEEMPKDRLAFLAARARPVVFVNENRLRSWGVNPKNKQSARRLIVFEMVERGRDLIEKYKQRAKKHESHRC